MNIINKRGEITTQHIVILIVVIASFAIILFFLMRLGLGEMTEKEICHNSVVARGSSVLPEESIPLNCHREYVCITEDGTCEQMTKPRKEKVETKEEVYEVLANEMADCWWMFGEGEINYVGKELTPTFYCSICDQIAFDGSVDFFENDLIDREEFYRTYLAVENVSGEDITYSEYLYGTNDVDTIKEILLEQNSDFGNIALDKQHYIMMGISSDVSKTKWASGAGGILSLVGFIVTKGNLLGAVVGGAVGAGVGTGIGFVVEGLSGDHYLSPSIIEVNSEEFKALECKSIATLA